MFDPTPSKGHGAAVGEDAVPTMPLQEITDSALPAVLQAIGVQETASRNQRADDAKGQQTYRCALCGRGLRELQKSSCELHVVNVRPDCTLRLPAGR